MKSIQLTDTIKLGDAEDLPLVAGPCVIESPEFLLDFARQVRDLSYRLELPLIFKASFDKANRSSIDSFRGPGLTAGLEALTAVKTELGLPLLTDVHDPKQCEAVANVCDVLQIPAFLCRQTDLIVAAAATGRPVLIKKGQFMAPTEMLRSVDKARSQNNPNIGVTERGTSFGYNNLVVDMRCFEMLHAEGIPVMYDVTHSLQLPGALGVETGGDRRFAEPLALAAIAAGADGLYLETHPHPEDALCDRATQLPLERAASLIEKARALFQQSMSRQTA
jgi:2-dehydro-3-deoxyphosphooctonate aldolase (KDO 8-P synthase)